ncbi:putative homeobox and C2H2 transcription factor [Aspergillus steynii IBT 23096]|uniref:Putative homeobox and C2H2 transcription factor n=1 Tax=Aspergillus steynii IBT 23096 TaxID=1392250 RepID=A0A2I2G7T5_9EURO|nr:putative homeobox and C2H2 transcription factor [Aspergillus steynii IBT 23096]PLB48913.1 putative homeobox and C2H2 transcription factor [Aspergillus steynii IBT 23096]
MEYFDFDEASFGSHLRDDDVASDNIELDENDAVANFDSLAQEQDLEFPNDPQEQTQNVAKPPAQDAPDAAALDGIYPMSPAKDPCDFCRNMGLDCFVAKRGVMMQNGCTCCISLYRKCSFTHAKAPGKFLDTLDPINENIDIPTGGLTGKKALKSLSGIGFPEDTDARARKSTSRLSREAVRVLKTWLQDHKDHPYPNDQEKDELKLRTGLKRSQICNWLANARRRGKVRPSPRSSSPVPGAVDIPGQSPVDLTLMTPLERWKHSPPENEPATKTDILRALVNTSLDSVRHRSSQPGHVPYPSRMTGSSNDSSHANSNMFHTPSISSLETSRSASRSSLSDLSFASAFSHHSSLGSFGSMDRKERRRRRKPSASVNTLNQQKTRSARIFQCTFCAESFQTKYDWQRHEKSLHLALEKWTCSPFGGVSFIDGANRCVFCMEANPDNDHLESHNYSSCQEKTPTERTFYRKDHLNQHLRLMHNVKFHSSMDSWRSNTCEIRSRCGFCGTVLTSWKGRTDHLAAHFKNGADMTQWQGDWGFDPLVQNLVENAMPPYLIGQERHTLDPYTASHIQGRSAQDLNVPDDANCFQRLQRELTVYIHNQKAVGVIPTDLMLQDEARRIVYANDDRWNQTCADNPVWLSVLKRDTGIEVVPGSDHIQFANLGMRPPFAAQGGLSRAPIETNLTARTLRYQRPFSPANPGSGFQSPALPGTGQSSVAASVPGSSAGSYVGSAGMMLPPTQSGLSTDWGSSFSAGPSSFSTPLSGSADPFIQMGFDPEFLQRLNQNYDELDLEDLQGLNYPATEADGGELEPGGGLGTMASANLASAPIPIPSPPKQPDALMSDAAPLEEAGIPQGLHFPGRTGV